MGFLKRFFSVGSKKDKKRQLHVEAVPPVPTHHLDLQQRDEQEQEAVASRLLRSSSARFAVVSEIDYASLPPIPHPINTVSRTSTISPMRSTTIPSKSTYTVTVHGRMHHSQTEFPNAYPPLKDDPTTPHARNDYIEPLRRVCVPDPRKVPITPRDQNRLNRLRQDPSVASLLHMYDDHGRLDEKAFSNTPPSHPSPLGGRPQKARRESTLRELLGVGEGGFDGDISWAERCLDNCNRSISSLSTTSSLGVQTPAPATFDTTDFPSEDANRNNTLSTDPSLNTSSTMNYPIISSMEVELSAVIDVDDLPISTETAKTPYPIIRTPSQRASQVFNFLAEKRPKMPQEKPYERNLPSLPSPGSSVFDMSHPPDADGDAPYTGSVFPALPALQLAALDLPPSPPSPAVFQPLKPPPVRSKTTSGADRLRHERRGCIATLMDDTHVGPRGPRPPSSASVTKPASIASEQQAKFRRAFGELTNGNAGKGHLVIPPVNTAKSKSTSPLASPDEQHGVLDFEDAIDSSDPKIPVKHHAPDHKLSESENTRYLAETLIPLTPVRTRVLHQPNYAPSPASSSELSPLTQQIMTDLRTKRMRAREREAQAQAAQRRYKGTRLEL